MVPIHAYPVIDTTKFPRHVKFPSTPIGQTRTKTVSLECGVPVDFEYQLSYLQRHPAFTVEPLSGLLFKYQIPIMLLSYAIIILHVYVGTVPANGKVDIVITFTPSEYNTATVELKVNSS